MALYFFDRALTRTIRKHGSADVDATRWFLLHATANFFVCIAAWTSVASVVDNPLHAMDPTVFHDASFRGNASPWPLTIINSLHVYHMVGNFRCAQCPILFLVCTPRDGVFSRARRLTSADYFHHLLFIPTIGIPGQLFQWGALGNFQAFFISGLPGGIDYFLLGLHKLGLIDALTEKRTNANLNTWIRVPGVLTSTVLLCMALKRRLYGAPFWAITLQLTLPPYNCLYFAKQSVANYSVHYMLTLLGEDEIIKTRIQQRKSCTTGTEIMAWRDAIAVPQRGS